MELGASWVAAIASVVSALVVAIASVAAIAQIRYIRSSNEITVYLRMIERADSLEFAAAFAATEPLRQRVATDTDLRLRLSIDERVEEFCDVGALLQLMEHLTRCYWPHFGKPLASGMCR